MNALEKDMLCHVCGDKASGKHYGVPSCDGCRGFFKRSIRRNLEYACKEGGKCIIDVTRRNQCQACRFAKCLKVNMKRDAVQHERAPRSFMMPLEELPHQKLVMPMPTTPHSLAPYSFSYHPQIYIPHHTLAYGFRSATAVQNGNENEVSSSEEIHSNFEAEMNYFQCPTLAASVNVYESATKLLFLAIRWTRTIPSFLQLKENDQLMLVMESWNELFMLNAIQWSFSFSLADGLAEHHINDNTHIKEFQKKILDIISRFNYLKVDCTEYACLKALVLFKPESKNLQDRLHVELLQDQTQLMLHEYCLMKHNTRFGKLLLLLASANSFNKSNLEELFFCKRNTNISVQTFIVEVLR